MDMREPMASLLKTRADFALGEILLDIFKVARRSGLMTLTLENWTVGPDVVHIMWDQCGRAYG